MDTRCYSMIGTLLGKKCKEGVLAGLKHKYGVQVEILARDLLVSISSCHICSKLEYWRHKNGAFLNINRTSLNDDPRFLY